MTRQTKNAKPAAARSKARRARAPFWIEIVCWRGPNQKQQTGNGPQHPKKGGGVVWVRVRRSGSIDRRALPPPIQTKPKAFLPARAPAVLHNPSDDSRAQVRSEERETGPRRRRRVAPFFRLRPPRPNFNVCILCMSPAPPGEGRLASVPPAPVWPLSPPTMDAPCRCAVPPGRFVAGGGKLARSSSAGLHRSPRRIALAQCVFLPPSASSPLTPVRCAHTPPTPTPPATQTQTKQHNTQTTPTMKGALQLLAVSAAAALSGVHAFVPVLPSSTRAVAAAAKGKAVGWWANRGLAPGPFGGQSGRFGRFNDNGMFTSHPQKLSPTQA